MRERWRYHLERANWSVSVFAGWSSCTLGIDVESHQWDHTVTVRVPFVWVVVEWWRS